MDNFVNLHNHCMYSLLDGFGHPSDFVKRAKELNQTALAITDHGSISSHKKFYDSCIENGIKPILGIEAYIVDNALEKNDRERWHITLLAKNLVGYRNLNKLVTMAYGEGFYYKPRIDWEMLKKYGSGLIATSGCPSGKIGQMIVKQNLGLKEIAKEMKRQEDIFDKGCYFIELQPWYYEEGKQVAKVVYRAAMETKIPMVLTMDCHYPRKEDATKQDIMLCIQNGSLFSDPKRMKFSQTDFYLKSGQQMKEDWEHIYGKECPFLQSMIDNTAKIADMIDFKFPMAKPISYPMNLFDGKDKVAYFKKLCDEGMEKRELKGIKEYEDRYKREFELVVVKEFVDYFLVVWDLINWAKKNDIWVGPARGSSCGSLVCYILHITEIDPLKYDLLFERFIDANRSDLPDIDIDFQDDRRGEVKDYLREKYGADHVASLATFGTFKGRLCIQDIGRVFKDKIPASVINEVKKLIVQRSGGDSRFGFTVEDTFVNFDNAKEFLVKYPELGIAKYLEGQVRQLGIHAAGTIVSNEPITNFAAFYRSNNDEKVISMDYEDTTSIGLLKIDILGLITLTVLRKIVELVKDRHHVVIDLYKLPLDDPKVYEYFKTGKLFGIFQFDGTACMAVCKQVKPDNFRELYAVNALSRPGPLHNGGTLEYVERKFGRHKVEYKHPILEEITKDTYGVTIYQEQVMRVVKDLGKFSWKDTSTIRKTMSKSTGVESFSRYEEMFIKGAMENGMKKELAREIFKEICSFGSWAFNLSHAVAYTHLAYFMMWLKVYYPIEFYVSLLQTERSEGKVKRVIKEYLNEGNELLLVDINKSQKSFVIEDKSIRIGLTSVVDLGDAMSEEIIKKRPFTSFIEFKDKVKGSNKIADTLLKIGAFSELKFDSVQKQQSLFGDHLLSAQKFDYKIPDIDTLRKFLPLAVQDKVRQNWMEWIRNNLDQNPVAIKELEHVIEKRYLSVIGTTDPNTKFNPKNRVEEVRSKGLAMEVLKGEPDPTLPGADLSFYDFLNFEIEDETDYVTVRIPYKHYKKYKDFIWSVKPNEVLLIKGMSVGGIRMLFASDVISLTRLKEKIDKHEELTKQEQSYLIKEFV